MHTQQIYEHSPSNFILFIWESPEKEEKYLQQIHAGKLKIFFKGKFAICLQSKSDSSISIFCLVIFLTLRSVAEGNFPHHAN